MRKFNQILNEDLQPYTYHIKLACDNTVTDELIDALEQELRLYDIEAMGLVNRTPIQEHPLDFPNLRNKFVHTFEVVLAYPATIDVLRRIASETFELSMSAVAVYTGMDPRKEYTDEYLYRNSKEFKDDYVPAYGSVDNLEVEEPPALYALEIEGAQVEHDKPGMSPLSKIKRFDIVDIKKEKSDSDTLSPLSNETRKA